MLSHFAQGDATYDTREPRNEKSNSQRVPTTSIRSKGWPAERAECEGNDAGGRGGTVLTCLPGRPGQGASVRRRAFDRPLRKGIVTTVLSGGYTETT